MTMLSQPTVASGDPSSGTRVAVDGGDRRRRARRRIRYREACRYHGAEPPAGAASDDALRAAGLFRLFTPRALGGLEIDPVTFARVVEEVSTFDCAAGWAFQVNTNAWWTSRMSPEGIAELYADGPDLMMAASFAPPHRAEEVSGGYRITGHGPLASTIHDSRWALMSAIVFDGDQRRVTPAGPDFISVVMRTTEVEMIDTWDSLGMRGTDSNDIEAKGLFPIIAPVALAIAAGPIRELRNVVTTKVPLGMMKTARDRAAVQSAVAEAEAMVRSARLFFYDT
jgi:alkylation response protein AidB-like acyl-CoA dehydrogenase